MTKDYNSNLNVEKPNLVIFMPDQLRYDSLGCFGNKIVKTPNIDKFAKSGLSFTNCYVQASVCSQSRCSMFTGQYSHVAGHRSLEHLIKPWEPNLFRSMKENGYHIACLAPRGDTFAPTVTEMSVTEYGFLVTPNLSQYFKKAEPAGEDDVLARLFYKGIRDEERAFDFDEGSVLSAEQWLENPPKEPWVLFLPLMFPHCPFQVEEPYFSMYDRKDMPEPSKIEEKVSIHACYTTLAKVTTNMTLKTGYEPQYMKVNRERYGTHRATSEMWAEISATYYGMITRIDDQFGRIMDLLEKKKLYDSTITMFFTDHGEYLGDHGLIEKWPSGLSDTLVKEPLIISGAGLPAGKVINCMVEMVDLVPTIFEMCGIPEHFPHNGKSLIPAIMDGAEHRQYAFSEGGFLETEEPLLEKADYPYDIKASLQHEDTKLVGKAISVRSKEWTYIYRLYEPSELYSRINDPQELHNLAADPDYVHIAKMLEAVMFKWLVETCDFLPWSKDPRFPEIEMDSPKKQMEDRERGQQEKK
jgi:arylsulfatase A-like enzyme